MRILAPLLLFIFCSSFTPWETNFEKAKQKAVTEHKAILLNFSGSDWCGPCLRLNKEILESSAFLTYADQHLVMVNADFPRQKKNQLPKPLQQQNEKLADVYNTAGNFPSTLLISADGKIWKVWDGFPKMSIDEFINDVQRTIDANK